MEAAKIYEALSRPPQTALRQINAGNLKGKTDINPQWRYEIMTKTFGLVGIGWKYEVQKLWTETGASGEILAFAQVAVYVRDPDTKEWSDAIVGIGGSKLINKFSKGLESNDEGYKMAVTDAFSTSLKMIGVAADIYAGRWDGSKYKDDDAQMSPAAQQERNNAMNQRGPAPQQAPQQPQLPGGPDTPAQHDRIVALLNTAAQDGSPMFSNDEQEMYSRMRATARTADDTIKILENEVARKRQEETDAQRQAAAQAEADQFPIF